MEIGKILKKQFVFDGIVVAIIVIAVLIFFWISRGFSVGWDIEGEEVVRDEQKTVQENIYIHDGGKLLIESSDLELDYDGELSVWVEGDSELEVIDSTINSDEYMYNISLYSENGKSPKMAVIDSDIIGHYGIFLRDRTVFESENSVLGRVVMMDNSSLNVLNSQLFVVLDSDKKEEYLGLDVGDGVNFQFESREGWGVEVEDSKIEGYQVNIDEDDDVFIGNSKGINLLISTSRGASENFLSLPPLLTPSSGELEDLGFDLSWEDTSFGGFGFVLEETSLKVENTVLLDIMLTDSDFEARESSINCMVCQLFDSNLELNTVEFDESTHDIEIFVYGDSHCRA